MAATLIHWKSRSLLPRDVSEDPRKDPIRDDLIQQLLAHRQQAADELARRATQEARFTRSAAADGLGSPEPAAEEADEAGFVSVWDLIQQARDLARWAEQHRANRCRWRESFGVEQDDTTVSEMMDYLRHQLAAGQATASRRSCLFLGMLEMARDQQVERQQNEIFGPIWISRLATA